MKQSMEHVYDPMKILPDHLRARFERMLEPLNARDDRMVYVFSDEAPGGMLLLHLFERTGNGAHVGLTTDMSAEECELMLDALVTARMAAMDLEAASKLS